MVVEVLILKLVFFLYIFLYIIFNYLIKYFKIHKLLIMVFEKIKIKKGGMEIFAPSAVKIDAVNPWTKEEY